MPRQRRSFSATNIYHIMVRGNGGRDIFLDDHDRYQFLRILSLKKKKTEFTLYAFCLMNNHFHLALKEGRENISNIMQRINTAYALFINKKYQLTGHLFQNRFKSENVEDDAYLISLIRYIHQNPVKARIVVSPEDYHWSSYLSYFTMDRNIYQFIDFEDILRIFSENLGDAKDQFKNFSNKKESRYQFLEDKEKSRQFKKINTEQKLLNHVDKFLDENKISLKDLGERGNKSIRDQLILKLKEESIYSNLDIAKFLGMNRGMIQKVRKEK